MKKTLLLGFAITTITLLGWAAPIEFSAEVVTWDPSAGLPSTLTLQISGQYEVEVKVTGFTEIKNEQGFPAGPDAFAVGDQVEIEAVLTEDGWVALEVQLKDEGSEFELRGPVESLVDTTLIVNGFEIEIVDTTKILDQFGKALTLDELLALVSAPDANVMVKVDALISAGQIEAKSVKILSKLVSISMSGIVIDFDEKLMNVDFGGGITLPVIVLPETEVKGTVTPGALVQVKGYINAQLYVEALRIRVKRLFELVPDEVSLAIDEEREVLIVLEQELDFDLNLDLNPSDPAIASVLTPVSLALTIPAGETSATFWVKGNTSGKSGISVTQAGSTAEGRTLKVTVGDDEEGEEEGEEEEEPKDLEIKWTPGVIHAANAGSVEIRLMLKHGPAPEALDANLELVKWSGDPSEVSFPSTVAFPAGSQEALVTIQFQVQKGKGAIRASLPEEVGGSSDLLEIEFVGNDPEPKGELNLEWTPDELEIETGGTATATLKLSAPAPALLSVEVKIRSGKESTAEGSPATVIFNEGDTEASFEVKAGNKTGKMTFRAQLPTEYGSRHDDLKVEVKSAGGDSEEEESDD